MSYKARSYKQLYEWVNGNSIHNDIDKECCPDFSCCIGGGFAYPFNDYKNRVSYRDNFRKEKRKTIIRKMLVVCQNKDLHGFTYGRLYLFIYDPDLTETGYTWVKNDKGVIVGERINYFKKLTDWKKSLENRNAILWALTSGVL